MHKASFGVLSALGLLVVGFVWFQHYQNPLPQNAPLSRSQLVMEQANVSVFTHVGAPSEQVRLARLDYENPKSAWAYEVEGYSQPQQVTHLQSALLRYQPKRFSAEQGLRIQQNNQILTAPKAEYDTVTRRFFLTQPEIHYVP